jgi:hypothetical protein
MEQFFKRILVLEACGAIVSIGFRFLSNIVHSKIGNALMAQTLRTIVLVLGVLCT